MKHPHAGPAYTNPRIPDAGETVPLVALPTLLLFVTAWLLWTASALLALGGVWPWPVSSIVSGVAAFGLYTVAHESIHGTASRVWWVNCWFGRLSLPAVEPWIGYLPSRFVHIQHHRFTGRDDGSDPHVYAHRAPRWQLPLRWLTLDLHHLAWYARRAHTRPRRESFEFVLTLSVVVAVVVLAATSRNLAPLLTLWLLPTRVAMLLVGWSFNYLPHGGLCSASPGDHFKLTRNRVGAERVLTPLTLYQNYHLVHHLHPVVPFYRYIRVWRRFEEAYLENEPELSTARGQRITADEYRQMRERC
jgi:ring-1,2-phenylacetyl-CoA epoxidase subunit PaaE